MRVNDGAVQADDDAREAQSYKRIIRFIPAGIAIFASVVVAVALSNGSRQLLKDGIDWIYDVAFYGIAALVFGRGARAERFAALGAALVLVAASCAIGYDIFIKLTDPRPIDPLVIGFSALSAISIAIIIAFLLMRFRETQNPLIEATWLAARNDLIATAIYQSAQAATRILPFRAPEVVLDLFALALNLQAVWLIVRQVRADAERRTDDG